MQQVSHEQSRGTVRLFLMKSSMPTLLMTITMLLFVLSLMPFVEPHKDNPQAAGATWRCMVPVGQPVSALGQPQGPWTHACTATCRQRRHLMPSTTAQSPCGPFSMAICTLRNFSPENRRTLRISPRTLIQQISLEINFDAIVHRFHNR